MQRLKNQEDTNFSISNPLAIMMKRPKENIGLICREGTTPDTILETTNDTCHHRLLKKKTTMTRKRLISVTESDPSQKILRNSEMSNDHRSKVKDLLQRFSIILRVLSSKSVLISYSQFDKYCKDVVSYIN